MYEVDSYVFNSDGKEVEEKKKHIQWPFRKKIPIKYIEKKVKRIQSTKLPRNKPKCEREKKQVVQLIKNVNIM